MKRLFLATTACLLFLTMVSKSAATTWNAASGAYIDVSNAVAQTHYGDIVQIPAGTWTWTNAELSISGITVAGAGTNATFILDNLPVPSAANNWAQYHRFFVATTTTNALTRITGITFKDGGNTYHDFKGKIEFDGRRGPSTSWRLDHCNFINLNGDNVFVHGQAVSVIDHCYFQLQGSGVTLYGISYSDSYGDVPWATPSNYGSTNALYIEDCLFTNIIPNSSSSAAFDGYAGARVAFRHNIVWNTFFGTHGNDTAQRYRGVRMVEMYNNTFNDNQNFVTAMDFRSGTGVVFSNTVSGYSMFDTMENYRNVQPNYWGGVNGSSAWDSNSATVYYSGTHAGTNSAPAFLASGVSWTPGQWAGYVMVDSTSGRYDLIQNNSSNQLFMTAMKDLSPVLFTNGDSIQILYVGAALDEIGHGSGDLCADSLANWPTISTINVPANIAAWPHQSLDPLYSWGNTLNGNPSGLTSSYANIVQGREIYYNTVRPGYTPYTYPHPLQTSSGTVNGTGSSGSGGGGTTSTNATLSPPTGLHIIPQ
jgi:hypothetical protein